MNRVAKILAVLFCVTLCAGGVVLSPIEKGRDAEPELKIVPVTNPQPDRGIWIWA